MLDILFDYWECEDEYEAESILDFNFDDIPQEQIDELTELFG